MNLMMDIKMVKMRLMLQGKVGRMSAGVVAEEWRNLRLSELQTELDTQAADMAGRAEAAEAGRRSLVDASKDFKRTASEDVRKTVAPLLKLFQGEVDNLAKRAKGSEASFLALYRKIVSLPDPLPVLDNAAAWQKKAGKASDLELEVGKLRETLKSYSEEFAEVKNQEVTIRQLRERIKTLEEAGDAAVEERIASREATLRAAAEERERERSDAASALQLKLSNSEAEVKQLEANLAAARDELYRLRSRFEDKSDAGAAQVELLEEDTERYRQRAEAAERQLASLNAELAAARSAPVPASETTRESDSDVDGLLASLRTQLSAKEAQVAAQMSELGRVRSAAASASEEAAEHAAALEQRVAETEGRLAETAAKLAAMGDYEEIKSQLGTMMTMEFGDASVEKKSLEVLLLEKNKTLQSELTALKIAFNRLQGGDGSVGPDDVVVKPEPCEDDAGHSATSPVYQETEKATPASTPGPLQPLVDTFGALLGAEVASQFQLNPDLERLRHALFGFHPNASPLPSDLLGGDVGEANGSPAGLAQDDQGQMLSTPSDTLRSARAEEPVETALARLGLTDIEVSVKEGMPRYLAEQMVTERLQAMISENMANLGESVLNTSQVAANCRSLLSMYNLGQRLFAKSILNQSQGSLSELLSKPRPWARLTEKGREAFRKMYAWVSDERAITLLRSLSPRRSYLSLSSAAVPPISTASPVISFQEELDDAASRSAERPASNRWRHDDIPKEMVQEIYQRELAKLREQENSISEQVKAKSLVSLEETPPPGTPSSDSPSMPRLTPSNIKTEMSPGMIASNGSLGSLLGLFPERQHRQRGLLRAVLPQITQDQFEQYSHLNTEDLVRQIKDFLSQHSISQRLFGEHVLGLSQGSVSDLLARPKPWHMLTQKGREPFIRMHLFLADPAAVENLRSRKASRGASTTLDARHSPLAASPAALLPKQDVASLIDSITRAAAQRQGFSTPSRGTSALPARAVSDTSDSTDSSDLDTAVVSDTVRRLLHENSVGQKLFGEAVLGVSQGTVSELLSKPKPWGTLSLRGREPYIRMNAWLQDPLRIEKLQQYMTMVKTGRAQKRAAGASTPGSSELNDLVSSLFQPATKKPRSLITEQQKEALKFAYEHEPYPSSKTVEFLAQELALSVPTVTNWFHNHRMRVKNQAASEASSAASLASPSSSSPSERRSASPSQGPRLQANLSVGSFSTEANLSATLTPARSEMGQSEGETGMGSAWKKGLQDLISLLGDDEETAAAIHPHTQANPILQDA